jgi:hypothetical protein
MAVVNRYTRDLQAKWQFAHGGLSSLIKRQLKTIALRAFPETALKFFSIRSRRKIEAQARHLGLDKLARQIARATGGAVAAGPFVGLKLNYEQFPTHASPKILGTYERELHKVLERVIELRPKYVLNVGCAEGFYAVGLAIRLDEAEIFAADADPKALAATAKNAALNGVSGRVHTVGLVKPGNLNAYLKSDASLLVMDCEGAEFSLLLDPANDTALLRTNIIVEIHREFGDPDQIIRRFSSTHSITEICPVNRSEKDITVAPIEGVDMLSAAKEWRGNQMWLFLEAAPLRSDYDVDRRFESDSHKVLSAYREVR